MAGQQFTDRLFAAVDARLAEQAARADALATRAGIMVAAIAVAASLLAGQVGSDSKVLWATYAALGLPPWPGFWFYVWHGSPGGHQLPSSRCGEAR